MKRIFYLLLFLVVLVLGISFAAKNPQLVEVNYYFDFHWTGPLSMLLLIALAVGSVLGVLFTLGWVLRVKRQASRTRKEVQKMEQEVANLRAIPIRDDV